MTKYSSYHQRRAEPEPERSHPVWRGIGCLMIAIVPVISYGLAVLTASFAFAQNWPLPSQLLGRPVTPSFLWSLPGLVPILAAIESMNNLYLLLALTFVYIVILGAIISFGYALVYQIAGPPRLGPLDVERPNIKVKRYKR